MQLTEERVRRDLGLRPREVIGEMLRVRQCGKTTSVCVSALTAAVGAGKRVLVVAQRAREAQRMREQIADWAFSLGAPPLVVSPNHLAFWRGSIVFSVMQPSHGTAFDAVLTD